MSQAYATPRSVVSRVIGTNDYVYIDTSDLLYSGETIVGTPNLTLTNDAVDLVNGTLSVVGGNVIKAQFDHVGAGLTRLDVSFSTNISQVVKTTYVMLKTTHAPSDGTVLTFPNEDQVTEIDARLDALEAGLVGGIYANVMNYGVLGDGVTNDTAAIQALLNIAPYVYFPPAIYMIDSKTSIFPQSNQNILLHPQAKIKIIPNDWGDTLPHTYRGIYLNGVSNVSIRGGQLLGDRSTHLGSTGEFGYGIVLNGTTDILLEDIYVADCWGDGFFIDGNSQRIHINRVISSNNRRQGMSVIQVDGLYVVESLFKDTNGTNPQSGVDLEPDSGKTVQNVIFDRCKFINNNTYNLKGQGFLGVLKHIQVLNCECYGIRQGFIFSNCSDIQIIGGRGHNGTYNGVHLQGVNGAIISGMSNHDNHGSGQGCGILIDTATEPTPDAGCTDIIVANNRLTANTYGIYIASTSNGVSLVGNRATGNLTENIHIENGATNITQV